MSEPLSAPMWLPFELWECVLLLLTPWEVLNLRTLNRGFRDLIDGSPTTQYRIGMFEAAVEEAFGKQRPPVNLADLRLQLERYRSRWDHFDPAPRETLALPSIKMRACEKGYLAYVFQTGSSSALFAQVIRLPSACNGVTRGEWAFDLGMSSPEVMVLGMALEPDLDLLVVVVSTEEYAVSQAHTLQLSDGQPHRAIPTIEPIRSDQGFRFLAVEPCVTKHRLAFIYLQPDSMGACTFRVYELSTGRIILDEPQCVSQIIFIDDFWLLIQYGDMAGGFTLWDTTNPTAPNVWFLQDPVVPFPGALSRITSSPGAMGVFRADPSRRVLAISGRVASVTGAHKRYHSTFVIRSSALIGLALGEKGGGTIEWEKWGREGVTIDHSPSRISVNVLVEGSRVFIQETLKGEVGFTVYDFTPGARKEQSGRPYTSRRIMLIETPTVWWPQQTWEVSGDAVVLFEGYPGPPATLGPSCAIVWFA